MRIFSGLKDAGRATLPNPLLHTIKLDHATACSLSANGRNVVVATAQARRLLAYTITPPGKPGAKPGIQLRREFPPSSAAHLKPACAALLAPNSKFIVSVGSEDDRSVKLWSLGGDLICSVESKQAVQYGASISADSRLVAVAAASHGGAHSATRAVAPRHGQVSVYEVLCNGDQPVGLRQVLNVAGHTRGISAVSFANDCVHLGLASKDGEWSVVGTDVRYDLRVEATEHARGQVPDGRWFEQIALSPFAKRLVGATASDISIIDVSKAAAGSRTEQLIAVIPTAHAGTTTLCFSNDGLRVLSGGEDGRLRLWRVDDDDKAGTL